MKKEVVEQAADLVVRFAKEFLATGTGKSLSMGSRSIKKLQEAIYLYENSNNTNASKLANDIAILKLKLKGKEKEWDDAVRKAMAASDEY